MNSHEDDGEDETEDYVIQRSIHEACKEAFLKSPASLAPPTAENLRVLAAIEQGEASALRDMLRHAHALAEADSRGWLPLHRAASQPNLDVLEAVLTRGGLNLEERTGVGGETALTLAVKGGLASNVSALLVGGASPNTANATNESPLLLAVRAGSYAMASALVSHGAWVEQVCRKNWSTVHEAAKAGHVDVLMLLLRNGGRVNQKDVAGVTPLAVAAEHGHFAVTEILLNCGSRVNAQACNGESVLLDAAGTGNTSCIQLLLDNGADPNLASAHGHLPLHKAAYAGHYEALKLLIPLTSKAAIKEAGLSPLHTASEGGQSGCLQLLLSRGFDVNFRLSSRKSENYRDMRRSALYFAVSNGDAECARVLLAAGARTDLDPLCCLLVAVRSGRYDMVRLLLDANADVNCHFGAVSDTSFPTALQYCLKDQVMMRMLLNHGYQAERCFRCHHDNACQGTEEAEDKIPFCDFMSLCCLVHLAGGVVRTLLDYLDQVHICSKLRHVLEKQPEWTQILDILCSPRSLGHLCRLSIRRRLTLKRLNNTEVMNSDLFPPGLRSFILYRDLDLYKDKH
ncbi:ankyrin repeat and SOCS box protein 15 isoform X1 [Entelurus aequoreus]|uniref:ankyrin repeat and SOCS box protein 15 isoform X1 n=1 Tax=Entelurus aequoreus TaxID=161455 RepID=UPI002B1E02C0|nr:ankyrin repeat and SOCS box protein 15 isoform X1 [Entelurus aequoreus]